MRVYSVLLLCAGYLGGCAALSESQCRTGDWTALGERDGRAGQSEQRLQEYQERCARYGITPDPAGYRAGRAQGLAAYCTPEAVFASAREGHGHTTVCPAAQQAELRDAQQRGGDLYRVESELIELHASINRLEVETLRRDLGDAERSHARALLSRLYREHSRLELLAWRMESAFRSGRPPPIFFGRSLIY